MSLRTPFARQSAAGARGSRAKQLHRRPSPHSGGGFDSKRRQSSPEARSSRGQPYLPSLDGLRAVAVIAVMIYHARPDWLPGGFLGVDVFFAVSGFIITRTLVAEWQEDRGIDVWRFYLRRARRLLPALGLAVAAVLTFTLIAHPAEVARLRLDALAAAGQVVNWRFVLAEQSYFDSFARPSALRHLWSLAIEEQFYLVWPLFLTAGLRLLRPRLLALPVVLLALGSTGLMVWLYSAGASPSRLYYGTDTRAAGLLVGAALALWWTARPIASRGSLRRAVILDLLCYVALVSLGVAVVLLDQSQPLLYQGGFAFTALASAVLIFATAAHAGLFARMLSFSPLRRLGQRSYGVYLWHWPLALLTWPHLPTALQTLAEITAAIAIASLSYELVERPVSEGALGRLLHSLLGRTAVPRLRRAGLVLATLGALGAVVTLGVFVVQTRPQQVPPYLKSGSIRLISDPALPPNVTAEATATPAEQAQAPLPEMELAVATSESVEAADAEPEPPPLASAPAVFRSPPASVFLSADGSPMVTAIGDSVMLGAAQQMAARIPRVDIDAAIGRQTSQAVAMLWERLQDGMLGEVVVVNLGNNGTITDAQFDQIMEIAGPVRRVVFVNNKVPRQWEATNNAVIANGVRRYTNAVLVDWHTEAEAHPDFFTTDFVHLRPEGANAFANMVAAAIKG